MVGLNPDKNGQGYECFGQIALRKFMMLFIYFLLIKFMFVKVYFPNQNLNRIEFSMNQSYHMFTNKSHKHCKYNNVHNFAH